MFPSKGCKGIKEALDRTRGVQMSLLSSLVQLNCAPLCLGTEGSTSLLQPLPPCFPFPLYPGAEPWGSCLLLSWKMLLKTAVAQQRFQCKPSTGSAGPENPQIQVPKSTPCRALHCKPDYLKCREIYFQLHSGISLCLEAWREEAETFPQSFALICGHNNLILQLQDPNPISFPLGYEFLPTLGAPEAPWCCH